MNSTNSSLIAPPVLSARPDGEELLDTLESLLNCVSMTKHARRTCALWGLATHVFDEFAFTPRLVVYAPAPQSGKTTLLERLATVVARPDLTHDITPAVFFRQVDESKPTVILDDYDSLTASKKRNLLNLLNSGFGRSGSVKRFEAGVIRRFSTFAPLAIGTNERLPFAPSSRSVTVYMQRPRRDELPPAPVELDTAKVAGDCVRWAERNRPLIRASHAQAHPKLGLDLRQANCWGPLLSVALLCGPKWAQYGMDAAKALSADAKRESPVTPAIELLGAVRDVFKDERMFGRQLAILLRGNEDEAWNDIGLTPNKLTVELRKFRIFSRQIRIGRTTGRGYLRADFDDVWSRYLDPEAEKLQQD